MDSEINVLDVIHSMLETDRAFYQTLRFLGTSREQLLALHQRNGASIMAILRLHLAQAATSNFTYTATIPLNLPAGWNDPVVVRPTAEQIAEATTRVEIRDSTCAICQEDIEGNGVRIHYCEHVFHDNCIAEWFTRSVHCPNCRHDVRVPRRPAPTSSDQVHTPPRVHNRLAAWLVGADPTHRTEGTEESDEHHA